MNNFLQLADIKLSNKQAFVIALSCLCLGVIYFALSSAYIGEPKYLNPNTTKVNDTSKNAHKHQFKIEIFSLYGKDVDLNIVASPRITRTELNNEEIKPGFDYPKTRVSHNDKTLGDLYLAELKQGHNNITVTLGGKPHNDSFAIGQRLSFIDYLIFMIFLVLPLTWFGFRIFVHVFDYFLTHTWKPIDLTTCILIVAIGLRILYAWDMGSTQFQHDYHGHIEYLEFIAHEKFVPLPHKAWEFPQQPFYYIANGSLWHILEAFGVTKESILKTISLMGALLSCISLYFAYRLLPLLTSSRYIQNITLAFLCFTPSLIYMSTRINNDAWAASFAIIALYYVIASYQSFFRVKFIPAVIFCGIAFLTKISLLILQLLFIALLVTSYCENFRSSHIQTIRNRALTFAAMGAAILSYTLYRAYYPVTQGFFLVNSGIWGGQDLRPIELKYFFSFNFFDLLKDAQGNITGKDNHAITRSFPTYQYITMLFGELKYQYWRDRNTFLLFNMQFLTALSLIVPLGWLAYISAKKNILEKYFLAAIGISFLLVLKFTFEFPSVSNTDFRYHLSVFFMLAFIFAKGLDSLRTRFPAVDKPIKLWVSVFFVLKLYFMFSLIQI